MALTKVTGQVINDTTGLVVGVTTVGGGISATDGFFSGIVTAVGDASFSGNVSVAGTLTYEDVTNIDAVGLVTARNGIVVGSGITLSKDGDIFATGITTISENLKVGTGVTISPDGDAFFTGVCTATSFSGDGSSLTGISGVTINNNADNRVITGSGSANTLEAEATLTYNGTDTFELQPASATPAIFVGDSNRTGAGQGIVHYKGNWNGTTVARITMDTGDDTTNKDDGIIRFDTAAAGSVAEAMRIGSEGNLALGGTNTAGYSNQSNFFIGGVGNIYADTGTGSGRSLSISNNAYINAAGNWVYRSTDKASNIYQYDGTIGFRYAASGSAGNTITWSEACRITNAGKFYVGTTDGNSMGSKVVIDSTSSDIFAVKYSSEAQSGLAQVIKGFVSGTASGTCNYIQFQRNDGDVRGSITVSGTSNVSYNTSSDYRLKENIVPISDGITRLKTLKPSRFNFIDDTTNTLRDGFIAHEVSTAIPEAVTGTKDAVDENGEIITQQLDQSKLVPLLTAALQEAIAKIEVLETEVAALKSS